MLRIHSVTSAKISSTTSVGAGGCIYDNGRFSALAYFVPFWYESHSIERKRLGGLEPDIFGENIRYPHTGLYHKWDSIRHTKVDGDLYPFVLSDVASVLPSVVHWDYTNQFTGSRQGLIYYFPWDSPQIFTYDLGSRYRAQEKPMVPNTRHILGRSYWMPLSDEVVVYYMISATLWEVDGKLSWDPYTLRPFGRPSLSLNVWKLHKNQYGNIERRVDSVHTASIRRDFESREFLASGSSVIYECGRYLEELIKLSEHNFLFGSSLLVSLTPLRGVLNLQVHEPNYDAIFAENRRNPNWRELAASAYQNLGMSDINGIAYITDLINMGAEVRSFAATLKTIPSSKVKAVASAWLAVHYGFKLTLLDAKTLYDTFQAQALRNSRLSKCQAATSWTYQDVSFSARYQVFYDQFGHLATEFQKLMELTDATVTSENLWDMVPFSFVIDWFVSLGDVLQSLDNYANLIQKHEVLAVGRSIKGVAHAKASQLGLPAYIDTSNITITMYLRRYERSLLPPSLIPSVTVNPFNHLVEGAALWISRK